MTQNENGWIMVEQNEYVKGIAENYFRAVLVLKDNMYEGTVYSDKVRVPEYSEGSAEEVALGLLKDAIKHNLTTLYRAEKFGTNKERVKLLMEFGIM